MTTVTASNVVFLLGIESVFPTAQRLQEFGTDDAFLTTVVDAAEVQIGVDGYGVAGYVPRNPHQTIRLNASSQSIGMFDAWVDAMDALQDVLYCNAVISYPSLRRKFTLFKGSLMRSSSMADARRVLANREFEISWLPQGPGRAAISAAPI